MALLTRQHPGEGFDADFESAWDLSQLRELLRVPLNILKLLQ